MIVIDGSLGEGGGQIVRTSLALSLVTGEPFKIENVRARRDKPGLQRQHVTAVKAAADVGRARTCGAELGGRWFNFHPGRVEPGDYTFAIGSAGSTTLVLQTILPPLMIANSPSRLAFEGGTHNHRAPPFEFIAETFLPLINRMGPRVEARLGRFGFYPPGGGRIDVELEPTNKLGRIDLLERGEIKSQRATAIVVKLPRNIADREIDMIRDALGWSEDQCQIKESRDALSPGNVVLLRIGSEHVTEVISALGRQGVRAEAVAQTAAAEAQQYLENGSPVGEHLADQLLIPLALAGQGSFVTGPLSLHTTTNIEVIRKFLGVALLVTQLNERQFQVTVGP